MNITPISRFEVPSTDIPSNLQRKKRGSISEGSVNDLKAPKLDLGCLSGPSSPRSSSNSTGITPRLGNITHWSLPRTELTPGIPKASFDSLKALAEVSNSANPDDLVDSEKGSGDSGYESDTEQDKEFKDKDEEEDEEDEDEIEAREIEAMLMKAQEAQSRSSKAIAFTPENIASAMKNIHPTAGLNARKTALSNLRLWLSLPSQNIFFKPYMVKLILPYLERVSAGEYFESDINMCRDALWCLTYLSTGNLQEKHFVVEAIPQLVQMLKHKNKELTEQALWTLGELASSEKDIRQKIIECGAFPNLLDLLEYVDVEISFKRKAMWVLSCLCESELPDKGTGFSKEFLETRIYSTTLRLVKDIVTTKNSNGELINALRDLEISGLLTEVSWALCYFSSRKKEKLKDFINDTFIQMFCSIFGAATDMSVETDTLNVDLIIPLTRLLAGNWDEENLMIRQHGFVSGIIRLLSDDVLAFHRGLTKEAAWVASGLCLYGGDDKIMERILSRKILPQIYSLFKSSLFDIQKDVAESLFNLAYRRDKSLFRSVFTGNEDSTSVVQVMMELLSQVEDESFKIKILDFVECVLERIKGEVSGVDIVEKANGIEAIESLCYGNNRSRTLENRASNLIDKYYGITYKGSAPLEPELTWYMSPHPHHNIARGKRSSLTPAWMKQMNLVT